MDHINLLGSEDVQRAGHTISDSADRMQRAASQIDDSLERFLRGFTKQVNRLEDQVQRLAVITGAQE